MSNISAIDLKPLKPQLGLMIKPPITGHVFEKEAWLSVSALT